MLDYEETLQLINKAQNGDESAKELLVVENSPLIKSVIKRFTNKGIEYDDLFQLGSIGFLKAINNFDHSFNVKFSTYCVPMIIGEIKRFLRDDGSIKVSRAIKGQNILINRFVDSFLRENGRKPTTQEIAKYFKMEECDVVFTMDSAKMPISIYTPMSEEGSKSQLLIDKFVEDNQTDEFFDSVSLKKSLQELELRDKQIVLLRFFKDKTQSEIAKELGISQVQVSRLENKILEKLREKLN